ncbi:MAG: hypothetical protein IPG50_12675 [Myxococcales bacterium]|nr:hypothetical protein [Myxococcales bacterium]
MRDLAGVVLVVAILAMVVAHVAIARALVGRGELRRACLIFVVPPLAPLWATERGLGRWFLLWVGGFAAYALISSLAG